MGKLQLAMATSHAFAVTDPGLWDEMRTRNRQQYGKLYGTVPEEHAQVEGETDEVIKTRYAAITGAHDQIRAKLEALNPDALIIIADDQNENFTDTNLPQFAVYAGERFIGGRLDSDGWAVKGHPELANAILRKCVESDIDMACIRRLPNDRLFAHAFGPVLRVVDPESKIPTVPVFANALHVPAPSPSRCYYVGQTIRRAVEAFDGAERVAIVASGGWSHFTSGYPWRHYEGPFGYGDISEDFDRQLLEHLRQGRGSALSALSSDDLISNGEIELRCWIVALGAIGDVKPDVLVYDTFYRGVMAMAVASWPLNGN
jgi:aromatic ring-opening dioxygenase catalytic subunit (LigB family)